MKHCSHNRWCQLETERKNPHRCHQKLPAVHYGVASRVRAARKINRTESALLPQITLAHSSRRWTIWTRFSQSSVPHTGRPACRANNDKQLVVRFHSMAHVESAASTKRCMIYARCASFTANNLESDLHGSRADLRRGGNCRISILTMSRVLKLGLLRVLVQISQSAGGLAEIESDETVHLPLGLFALYWLRLYKPLLDKDLPQSGTNRSGGERLGFAKQGLKKLQHVSPLNLRVGMGFEAETFKALHSALSDVCRTLIKMPMRYATTVSWQR